jgi:hypothetical protein
MAMSTLPVFSSDRPAWPLRLARWLLLALIVLSLGMTAAGLALFPDYAVRHAAEFSGPGMWTSELTQAALAELVGCGRPWRGTIWCGCSSNSSSRPPSACSFSGAKPSIGLGCTQPSRSSFRGPSTVDGAVD